MSVLPRIAVVGACLVLVACGSAPVLYPPSAPPDIKEACALTERRCTQCHDSDRIVDARKSSQEWSITIERMRQMPGSVIRPFEMDTILRCLRYRNDLSSVAPEDVDLVTLQTWIVKSK